MIPLRKAPAIGAFGKSPDDLARVIKVNPLAPPCFYGTFVGEGSKANKR